MFNKRSLVLLSTLLPLLVAVMLLVALRPPVALAAPNTIITVNTLLDENDGNCADGDCSLRDAIATANAGDTINFSTSGTINLFSAPHFLGELVIDKSLTISGSMPIIISGNNAVRVFNVITGTLPIMTVTFDGVTIANGDVQTTDCGIQNDLLCGGGIMSQSSGITLHIINSTLTNNTAGVGGAVFNTGVLTVDNSMVSGNWATGYGGGIATLEVLWVGSSTISDNGVSYGGGGVACAGTVTVIDSTFSRNSADIGGGISIEEDCSLTVNNSTFSDNTATIFGGAISNASTAVIKNSTITYNHAGSAGGGISNRNGGAVVDTTLINTIISGNTRGATASDLATWAGASDTFTSGGRNLIGEIGAYIYAFVNGVNGDQTAVNDPKLSPLADNGGPTLTHALLPDSPALDTGAGCGLIDQRGVSRPQDGDDNGTVLCDIGAYEYERTPIVNPCTTPVVVTSIASSGAGSLRQAISDVCADGLITFNGSLSGNTIDISPDGELVINKSVTISSSVPITVSGNNATRVFNVASGNVIFDGLTIANGSDQSTDCVFGSSYSCGGGILIQAGSIAVTVANSTLISNTAQLGGGIFSYDTVTISDSMLINNSAEHGGAITSEGVATISYSTIAGNTALGGGGIVNDGSIMTIRNSDITGNSATNEDGGGVANIGSGTITVTNSSFSGNTAYTQGGGILNRSLGTVIVDGSTFFDNLTGSGGSGLYNFGVATVNNSTFSENLSSTAIGGGIFNDNGTLTVKNSTLSGNGAIAPIPATGASIFNLAGVLHLYNSILANTPNGTDCYSDNGLAADVNNLIEAGADCGTPVSTADPLLDILQDNGGSTLTHALLPDSPAIDAGDLAYPVQVGDYDQRGEGYVRVINGRLDIGSYELQSTCITPIIVTNILSSGAGTLRQAIADVCNGGLITFDAPLTDQTINISPDGELVISKSVTISGTVPITVSGGNAVRVFNVMTGTTPTVDVTFDGLMITNGNVQTSDCGTFSFLCGGGVMIQNSNVAITIVNSIVFNNAADNAGGGIFNHEGTLTIDSSTVLTNGANTGSGIYNYQGMMDIDDSTVFGNVWGIEGGGIFNQGVATIANSAITGNSVGQMGGGIYNRGTLGITNSTISDNSASIFGGGLYGDFGSTLSINNSTFSENTASADGGGVYNHGIFRLSNTIIANTPSGNDCRSSTNLLTDVNNLIEANSGCGAPVSTGDPNLSPLADNGGSTFTHALLPDSPAIDAGDPNYSVQAGDYDQRGVGFDRVINGRLDIGSYELNQTCTTPIIVTSTLSSGAGTLRQAISDVCYGGLITFDAPLNNQTIDISPDGELVISKSLTISGTVPITVSGNNAVRVFNVMTGTAPVNITFDGLVIANGNDQITNCEMGFELCAGGILIQGSGTTVSVINSTLISNTADIGGGILNHHGTLVVSDSVFVSNVASGGGGLFNNSGVVTITNSALISNAVTDIGGGILNYQGTLVIDNSTLSDNTSIHGGGIFNQGSLLTVSNSSIFNNVAIDYDNVQQGEGGGILNTAGGILTVDNSTLSNNTTIHGGGIYNSDGTLTVSNSSIISNTSYAGGGIHNGNNVFYLSNTIIANSSQVLPSQPNVQDCSSAVVLALDTNNLIEANDGCGAPASTGDPKLSRLADNGGSTFTHALLPDSPAIDAGDPNYSVQAGDYDQRGVGFDRVINGRLDIGSYEMQTAVYPLTLNSDGAGTISCDGGCATAYLEGTVVTLTAVIPISSTFTGWSGAIISTDNPITLTLDAAKAVTATFALKTYDLSLTIAGNGAGSINFEPLGGVCTTHCVETYTHGTVVTLTAVIPISSTFTGWSGAIISTDNPITLTVDAAKAVTATFVLKTTEYTVFLPVIIR